MYFYKTLSDVDHFSMFLNCFDMLFFTFHDFSSVLPFFAKWCFYIFEVFFFTYWSRLFTLCSAKSVLPVIDNFIWDLSLMNLNSFWTYSIFKLFRLLEVSPGINFHSLTVPQPCRMTFPFGTFFPFPFLPFPAWRAQAPMLVFRRNLSPLLYAGTRNT